MPCLWSIFIQPNDMFSRRARLAHNLILIIPNLCPAQPSPSVRQHGRLQHRLARLHYTSQNIRYYKKLLLRRRWLPVKLLTPLHNDPTARNLLCLTEFDLARTVLFANDLCSAHRWDNQLPDRIARRNSVATSSQPSICYYSSAYPLISLLKATTSKSPLISNFTLPTALM